MRACVNQKDYLTLFQKQNKNKRKVNQSFYKNGVFSYIGLKANKVNAILTFDDNAC